MRVAQLPLSSAPSWWGGSPQCTGASLMRLRSPKTGVHAPSLAHPALLCSSKVMTILPLPFAVTPCSLISPYLGICPHQCTVLPLIWVSF